MNWLYKISHFQNDIPVILIGLMNEAKKCSTFEEFEKNFLGQIKHGMYWHVTDDPHFFINPNKGPRDMSSMSIGRMSPGALMITSDLATWALHYAPHRRYAALIDMSDVPSDKYKQVNRGFGNEFYISDPTRAKVVAVFPIKDALRIDYEHHESLPQNLNELREFWENVQNVNRNYPSKDDLLDYVEYLPHEDWNNQWAGEWAESWQN